MAIPLVARLQNYAEPLYLLMLSLGYLPLTIASHPLLLITSPSTFRSQWFGNFWRMLGPLMAASETQVDQIDQLLARARGTVLELGPGGGDQMHHYRAAQVDKVYGAEPNTFLHAALVESAERNGLGGGKFVALDAGAQPGSLLPALKGAGLIGTGAGTGTGTQGAATLPEGGVFDTVVAIKCLCSAPSEQLAATVAVVHALLKPGGEFLFFEHVQNDSDVFTMAYAWLVEWFWPLVMGGCRLSGKVDKVVLGMGGWDERKITTVGEFKGYEVFRYVKGICRKA